MPTKNKSRWLLVASILALVLTLGSAPATGYAYLSTRATRWGDSLIVGRGFSGETSLDGGAMRVRISWENGSPVMDAPARKGRRDFYLTFIWGFAVYHAPPQTLAGGKPPAQ